MDDLHNRRLKIATLDDINDPFELAVCCSEQVRRRALRETRRDWARRFGMLCFSGSWHNPVQWSHYADKHKGLCLGFDVPDALLTTVKYVKAPPQLDWDAIEAFDKLGEAEMIRWASTKFEHWSYEDEHRLFVALEEADESGRYFADFGPTLILREVLVGPESAVTRAQLDAALSSMAVDACKTRLAFRGYKVVRQHDPLMWH